VRKVNIVDGQNIGFIGCGNMGTSLLEAVVASEVFPPSCIYVADTKKERLDAISRLHLNQVDNISLVKNCGVIILAVKPADIPDVITEIKDFIDGSKILISIAAGISTQTIETLLADVPVPVIRVMPNLNVRVKAGLLPYCLGRYAKGYNSLAEKIFSLSGFVFELGEEKFDAITAISGSGPGFIFFIAEVIESICKAKSFTAEEADMITAYIIYGSGKMLLDTKTAPSVLKQMVASPGGTTAAGLSVFMERGLREILEEAIDRAEKRSREISSWNLNFSYKKRT